MSIEQYIRQGFIARGLPPHVADAFVMNMRDESRLNPGINEANPTVPGSRGGFGLNQWTGPRRRAYEAFASSRGAPLDNVDAQLDFTMAELKGPESAAFKKIMAAPDAGSAGVAVVKNFLRPAPEHQASRAAKYGRLGGDSMVPRDHDPQVAGQMNAPVFGSMSPGGGFPPPNTSIDPNVAQYAFGDEDKKKNRLQLAGEHFTDAMSEVKPPRIAAMPSPGDTGNALAKVMQNPSALAQMLLRKRMA